MAHVLFAAHDPGGARVLSAVRAGARSRGHQVEGLASGPADAIWREEGEIPAPSFDHVGRIDAALTGTSFGAFEKELWGAVQRRGAPVLACVDSWSGMDIRFSPVANKGLAVSPPTGIGVIDQDCRDEVSSASWCRSEVFVVGQPHLQHFIPRIRARRAGASSFGGVGSGAYVFFSEPIDKDFGRERRGFDQFDIAAALAANLARVGPLRVVVKPHPRESAETWRRWLTQTTLPPGCELRLADAETEDLLVHADGVIGMTTMVLLESTLVGIPTLSLQLGRKQVVMPPIDRYLPVVTEAGEVGGALEDLVSKRHVEQKVSAEVDAIVRDADIRLLDALQWCLDGAG